MAIVNVDLKFLPTQQVCVDGTGGYTVTGAQLRMSPNGQLSVPFYQIDWMNADGNKTAWIEEYRLSST